MILILGNHIHKGVDVSIVNILGYVGGFLEAAEQARKTRVTKLR